MSNYNLPTNNGVFPIKTVRKVFICTSCEGIYADSPVSECDCAPSKGEFIEGELTYESLEKIMGD